MEPSNTPNLQSLTTFDPKKGFSKVRINMGMPIVAEDLNDGLDMLNYALARYSRAGNGTIVTQDFVHEFSVVPLGDSTADPRSQDNFGITFGSLTTAFGIADTSANEEDGLTSYVVFDYKKLVDNGSTLPSDREYGNAMFWGRTTELAANVDTIRDQNKKFSASHRLAGITINQEIESANGSAFVNLFELPCRVVFIDGPEAGNAFDILAYNSTDLLLSGLSTEIPVGTEYVVVPGNTLENQRAQFDSKPASETVPEKGVYSVPHNLIYVHAWEDDISPSEDPSIVHSGLEEYDVSHRTKLSWCVRSMNVRFSHDDDGSVFVSPRPEHLQAVARSAFKARHRQILNDGLTKSDDDAYGYIEGWQSDSAEGQRLSDAYKGDRSSGLTRTHLLINEKYSADPEDLIRGVSAHMLFELVSALIQTTVVSSAQPTEIGALLMTLPPKKVSDLDTLMPEFHPNVDTTTLPAGQIPRLATTDRDVKYSDGTQILTSASDPGFIFAPVPQLLSTKEMSHDLVRARGVALNHPADGEGTGVVFEEHSGKEAPIAFGSLSEHLASLDTTVLASTGLGGSIGRTGAGSDDRKALPTSKNFVPQGMADSFYQSGQSTRSFQFSTASQLNPALESQGSVSAVDPLVSHELDTGLGKFVPGPGKYLLRDGTEVTPESLEGWSHYRFPESFEDEAGSIYMNLSRRNFQDGKAQAMLMRESLNFRKLAIKTSAHGSMDMFNFYLPLPEDTTDGHLTNLNPQVNADYGNSAVGLIQDPTNTQRDAEGNDSFQSYGDTFNNVGADTELRKVGVNDGLGRGSHSMEIGVTAGSSYSNRGPWERWERVEKDMDDLQTNRCTTFRLRYHIGDFYPGPEVDGKPVNALVDTLNLFVRFEPLPLVHWATMPKHMHPIIEESVSAVSGINTFLEYLEGVGVTDHLTGYGSLYPYKEGLITETTPDPVGEIGDIDPHNTPFENAYQPFVHWYHPNMEAITAPDAYEFGGNTYPNGGSRFPVYAKWGERSLIVPSIVWNSTGDPNPNSNAELDPLDDWKNQAHASSPTDYLGSHHSKRGTSGEYTETELVPGTSFTKVGYNAAFPFVPEVDETIPLTSVEASTKGFPGPVFVPAFRQYAAGKLESTDSAYFGFHPAFSAKPSGGLGNIELLREFYQWPKSDAIKTNSGDVIDEEYLYGRSSRNPTGVNDSSYDWDVPVLRAKISTTTVAAIVNLVRTEFNWDSSTWVETDPAPGSVGEVTTDTTFVGDLGTAIALSNGDGSSRHVFMHPLMLGIPVRKTDLRPDHNARNDVYRDAFEFMLDERETKRVSDPEFNPLVSTFKAIRHLGMAQKLLFNCSFRVLHTRPGGGYQSEDGPGSSKLKSYSTAPKSLTELFIVRDREKNQPVIMPRGASGPGDKPFLHFESIHLAARDTASGLYAHPNSPYMRHLYPMISDSLGGPSKSNVNTDLNSPTHGNTDLTAKDFQQQNLLRGTTGDTYAADPFDWAHNTFQSGGNTETARVDRLSQNSGIEIDLVSELRYVRENPTAHGLDKVGNIGVSWLDMMPSVEDLTAPGDHEIAFVLYTGRFGQKFADTSVPNGFNVPFCGCRITASIEVNRPNEKASSVNGGGGSHYGYSFDTHNVLGHS